MKKKEWNSMKKNLMLKINKWIYTKNKKVIKSKILLIKMNKKEQNLMKKHLIMIASIFNLLNSKKTEKR